MSDLKPSGMEKPVVPPHGQKFHTKPLLEAHLDLLNKGTFSDVTFIVGKGKLKKRIPCHQLFLKARSPVFEAMFSERWNEDKTTKKEVVLKDFCPSVFKKFLKFIYTDTLVAKAPEAVELLQIAHMYDVQSLVSRCEELLTTETMLDDVVKVFQAARKLDMIQLMNNAGDLMASSLSSLRSRPSFLRMDKETLMYILNRSDLGMKEVDLFLLAVQWAKNQSGSTLLGSLQDVLPLIRFPIMTLEEFTKNVVPMDLLPQATLIELFTYFGTDLESKESMASTLKFSTLHRQCTNPTDIPIHGGIRYHPYQRMM